MTAADWTVRAKRAVREAGYEHGHAVTFMAKPFAAFGNGLHLHLSLWRDGTSVFDRDDDVLRHWVGGALATLGGATSILVPTINSYRRQVDFAAVPTTPTWGEDNRGVAVRTVRPAVGGAAPSTAWPRRTPTPTWCWPRSWPAGSPGWRSASTRPIPSPTFPGGTPDDHSRLPASITAADALTADERLAKALGDPFVEHWIETRRWEWLMFHSEGADPDARDTTDWELHRYFEWV